MTQPTDRKAHMPGASTARSVLQRLILALGVLFAIACAEPQPTSSPTPSGDLVFAENCAVCHSLPILSSLFEQNRGRSPGFAYDALTEGNMRRVGSQLDEPSRRAVAEFFSGVPFSSKAAERDFTISPACSSERNQFDWNDLAYPSWGGSPRNHRSTTGDGGFTKSEVENLAVQWVVAFPEATQLRSQPTAAGGALFAGSHNGSVYSLDQETGCTRWHYKAATEVRSAVTIAFDPQNPSDAESTGKTPIVRAVFADRAANVYALDAVTGEHLWTQNVDAHLNAAITGSVTAYAGMLFVGVSSNDDVNSLDPTYPCCTHHGVIVALDAKSGEILWRTPTITEEPRVSGYSEMGTEIWGPSGASVWNTPTVSEEHGLVFVGAGNNHSRPATGRSDSVLAMEIGTGKVAWTYQAQSGDAWNAACIFGVRSSCPDPEGPDTDFGSTTMLIELDGQELLIAGQKSGMLHALDPATGELQWKTLVAHGGAEGGIRYGMGTRDDVLYVPSTDQAIDPSAGESSQPGITALSARDGSVLWATTGADLCAGRPSCDETMTAPPFVMSEAVFAGSLDGILYGLDRESGKILWQLDTAQSFTTLTGKTTRGGGIAGTAGPTYANGQLFISSGYGQAQRPGNALIALAPK